jgi:hypothetical protein
MLQKISIYEPYKGISIEAYTDGYSHDEYGNLYLISILGPDSAVKGISSGIVSLKEVTIDSNDDWESLSAMRGEKYRILSARLESGLLHQIVALDTLFRAESTGKRLIYVGQGRDARDRIFGEIRSSFGTPILPEWKNWLLNQVHNENLIEIMEGNVQIARLNLNEKQLDSIVSNGVSQRSISF